MRIGIAFNPRSGARRGDRIYRTTRDAILASGHTPCPLPVSSACRLEDSVRDQIEHIDAAVAIGGDGTLSGVINGILTSSRPETPVAFVPIGRGRDMARSVPSWSPERLGKGPICWEPDRMIDVCMITIDSGESRYFINACSIGLSAEAARIAAMLPRQTGSFSYIIGAAKGFLSTRATKIHMELGDGERVILDDVLLLAACNGKSFGGGLYIAPDAKQDDGLLEIVTVRRANLLDLLLNLPKLRRGTPFEHPALSRWRTPSVTLIDCPLSPIEIDGDLWGQEARTYSIAPRKLNWIGPRT